MTVSSNETGTEIGTGARAETFSLVGPDYPVPPPRPVKVGSLPVKGSVVRTSSGRELRLTSEIAAGGEGVVYATDAENVVVKVYHGNRLTEDLVEKLKVMVKLAPLMELEGEGFAICWPQDVVIHDGVVVGYAMRKGRGTPLGRFTHPSILSQKRHVKRSHLVGVAINVLKGLEAVYTRRILLGDINAMNILVDDDLRVYFIDTDSWQIGPFVCKVGRPEYCHPDWLGGRFENRPREPRSEAFALAILIFMILLPGKHPFSHVGGEGILENVKERKFPYVVRGTEVTSYENAPAGPWIYVWSHTPPRVKEKLYRVLTGKWEPKTFEELKGFVAELRGDLERYLAEIVVGLRTDEVFPNYYFIPDYVPKRRMTCPSCGKPFEITEEMLERLRNVEVVCPYCYKLRKLAKSFKRTTPRVVYPKHRVVPAAKAARAAKAAMPPHPPVLPSPPIVNRPFRQPPSTSTSPATSAAPSPSLTSPSPRQAVRTQPPPVRVVVKQPERKGRRKLFLILLALVCLLALFKLLSR